MKNSRAAHNINNYSLSSLSSRPKNVIFQLGWSWPVACCTQSENPNSLNCRGKLEERCTNLQTANRANLQCNLFAFQSIQTATLISKLCRAKRSLLALVRDCLLSRREAEGPRLQVVTWRLALPTRPGTPLDQLKYPHRPEALHT